jgi:hypothetical protein
MMKFDTIPDELKQLKQWVLWKIEIDDKGKPTKVPYKPNGSKASTTRPADWSSFDTACSFSKNFNGIGFVFTKDDNYIGIDLDKCIVNGETESWASDIVDTLNSYATISQGGGGIHIILKGELPPNAINRKDHTEIYTQGRYFCMTDFVYNDLTEIKEFPELFQFLDKLGMIKSNGKPPPTSASTPNMTNDQVLEIALKASNGGKIQKLLSGDTSDYPSPSEADQALVGFLAFYTQDFGQIINIISQTPLWDKKWQRHDYQKRTIGPVLERQTAFYHHKGSSASTKKNPTPKETTTDREPEPEPDDGLGDHDEVDDEIMPFPNINNDLCKQYIELMESVTEAPPSYHFFTFITTISMLLGRNAYMLWGPDKLYTNLWTMIVGQTGRARKSTAINRGCNILTHTAPDAQILPSLSTWEGLLTAMTRNDSEPNIKNEITMIAMSEFDGFLKKSRNEAIAHMLPNLCDIYDMQKPARSVTKGSPICVKNYFVSMICGIQPEVLETAFQTGDIHGGFAGRFCYVYDKSTKEIPIPVWNKDKEYGNIMTELNQIHNCFNTETQILFHDSCIPIWTDFYHDYRNPSIYHPLLVQINERMQNHVLKIAMIFAILDNKPSIMPTHLNNAIAIAYWLMDNNKRLFGHLGQNKQSKLESKIIDLVKNNICNKRKIAQHFGGNENARDIQMAIESLLKLGLIAEKAIRNDRGRPSKILSLGKD